MPRSSKKITCLINSLVHRGTVHDWSCEGAGTGNREFGCRDLIICTNVNKGKMCQKRDTRAEDLIADCPALVKEYIINCKLLKF